MNSNHVDKPTTITAQQFVEGGYVEKIERGECVVSYYGQPIRNLTPRINEDRYMVWPLVFSQPSGLVGISEQLTVEWLPQPATDRDAAAPLLPQTVHTIRYGTPEFEQLSRDDAEAEIARLRAGLELIVSKHPDIERPDKLDGESDFTFGVTRGLWRAACIARDTLAGATVEEPDHR